MISFRGIQRHQSAETVDLITAIYRCFVVEKLTPNSPVSLGKSANDITCAFS